MTNEPGLECLVHRRGTAPARERIAVSQLVIAGWTGRDREALERHIEELEAIGVKRPASTPIYYRIAASRLTTQGRIEASGGASSGEVEFVLLRTGGRLLLGVGSDHTDREVETYGITVSKQMCDKPLAPELWAFEEVEGHFDALVLRSWAVGAGGRTLYQEGSVAAMLPPLDIMAGFEGGLREGAAMFCGTLAALGGIRPAGRFEYEIEDPVLGRRIAHGYDVVELPVAG